MRRNHYDKNQQNMIFKRSSFVLSENSNKNQPEYSAQQP